MANKQGKKAAKIFYSYSRKDERYRDELQKYLITMQREGLIEQWYDRDIDAGHPFDEEIKSNLRESDIILCLLSQDYLSSEYIYKVEMQIAKEMLEKKEAVIIPIILRICDWQRYFFKDLDALPRDAKPIKLWDDSDEAFMDVSEGIRNVLEGKSFSTPKIEPMEYKVKFTIGSGVYVANGTEFITATPPYIKNDRTYMPIRALAASIGIDPRNILWDPINETITFMKDSKVIQMKVGNNTMLINGAIIQMGAEVELFNDEIMAPVGTFVQAFAMNAIFDVTEQTITIWS